MSTQLSLSDEAREVLATWYDESLINETALLMGSFFGRLFGFLGQHAVTINGRVHIAKKAPQLDTDYGIMLVGHELYHVLDQRQRGWGPYLLAYVIGWRPSHISDGTSHPMERDAYERGGEVFALVQAQRRDREIGGG